MHLKIWHKMIIGISIPSLIALLGGILTYEYLDDVKNRQSYVQIADDLKEHILEIRRNERNFFHYKNEEHLKLLENAILTFTKLINDISPSAAEEMGQEDISLLRKYVQDYPTLINNLYRSYQQELEAVERVRTEGRKLENYVANSKHAKELTTSFILHLRLLEKNYMLFRDKKSFMQLNSGLSQLQNITPFCYACKPYIEVIKDLFKLYEVTGSMEDQLRNKGRELQEITGKIALRERQRISSFITKTKRLLFIALVLLCTLGPFFVYQTATRIVAPIKRLAEITRKISEGDMTLRAPLKEHDETYSLALSFNTMLDHLQLTHQSLEKSLELLNEKQAQLVESEKRASLGLLVSGVAHELNNPLNNISLTAETMKEDLEDLSREELKDYINDILTQSERAQNIVVNLLDFARARRSTSMEKQDIVRVVKDSFNLVANQLRVNNINLVQDMPDTPLYIKGNRSKLEQILISIMTNAIQAMKENGTLTVGIKPDDDGKHILIKITDTGQGIPEEDIKNIFEPFYTTKAVGEGTGLGLAVSRSLVMEHKGEIEVESKLGVGTTFTIKLPTYEEALKMNSNNSKHTIDNEQ